MPHNTKQKTAPANDVSRNAKAETDKIGIIFESDSKLIQMTLQASGRVTTKTLPSKGCTITECHEHLRSVLGDGAPARVTLARHAASGALDRFIVRQAKGKRTLYDATAMVAQYEGIPKQVETSPMAGARSQGQPYPMDISSLRDQLARELGERLERRLEEMLSPLVRQVADLSKEVAQLPAVRQTLMLKYDAAAALQQERLARAEAELKNTRSAESGLEQRLMKITIELSKLRDSVQARLGN